MPLHYFADLGKTIEAKWSKFAYCESAFHGIAADAMTNRPPSSFINLDSIVSLVFKDTELTEQYSVAEDFAQPPLTLYMGRDFHIEVLFWTVALPGIHQHAFSGAFHVLEGSSLHVEYAFDASVSIAARLKLGILEMTGLCLLPKGSTRQIVCGQDLIHATYHLERPSATIVVRTHREEAHLPQFTYVPPGTAMSFYDMPVLLVKRMQLLRMLLAAGRSEVFFECLVGSLRCNDPVAHWYYFYNLQPLLPSAQLHRFLSVLAHECREHAEAFRKSVVFLERRSEILRLKRQVQGSRPGLLLALMLYECNASRLLKHWVDSNIAGGSRDELRASAEQILPFVRDDSIIHQELLQLTH